MSPIPRRRLLAGAGAAVACCAAGCATYGTPRDTAPAAPAPTTPAPAAAAPSSSAAAAPAGIAAVDDVPVGGGRVFAEQKVVVTRPDADTVLAFDATCPHQGCLVDQVSQAGISCPCHGSLFAVSDGAPLDGPAQAPLTSRQLRVEGGQVVLA
ncbi:Rieske (2Fe-2S) protein [Pseudonocardia alni]|uniref:Cytochrome bc1 complex Rieske iron-sulfur subunit n=1 Tax=Pseudonocardia alni TaxID=33907 RepID=A0A852W036_PSEA5|nr:Rieske (2Fe-2S) protein [Pseudonocardia antarctica]NYG02538.1 nitrite reductase/ring-hydroxylating ferredoxin subunit [Pseudonocardia antarctica]